MSIEPKENYPLPLMATAEPQADEPEADEPEASDPFDAAIGEYLSDAFKSHDAVTGDNGTRILTVTITLAEYRQLCRDSQRAADAETRYWDMVNKKNAEVAELNRRCAELYAANNPAKMKEEMNNGQ